MNANRQAILTEMGFKLWELRATQPEEPSAPPAHIEEPEPPELLVEPPQILQEAPDTSLTVAAPASLNGLDWDELAQTVSDCRACGLCKHRHQAVLGVGDRQADWLFIGEGPGAEEDARGEPFVGQAGKLLDNMLTSIGLKRGENVYIANAVKCRPEGNRTPHADEVASCRPFLMHQIELIRPKLIVLLGRTAVHSVLKEDKSLASMRKKTFRLENIPVLVSYHPAYLLRNLPDKAKVWEDLCQAQKVIQDIQN